MRISATEVAAQKLKEEQKLAGLKQAYINNNELMRSETKRGNELINEAGLIQREISAALAEHREVDRAQVVKKDDLERQAGIHFEIAAKSEVERNLVNVQISEQQIVLKNWSVTVTDEDVSNSQAEQDAVKVAMKKVADAIKEVTSTPQPNHSKDLGALQADRKKVLAKIALGEASNDDLMPLDAEIAETELLAKHINEVQSNQAETLDGLNARLNELKEVSKTKEAEHEELKRNCSLTKAEKKAREYIRTVKKAVQLQDELKQMGLGLGINPNRLEVKLTGFGFKSFDNVNFR